jgi:hypothetical protein
MTDRLIQYKHVQRSGACRQQMLFAVEQKRLGRARESANL